MSGRSKSILPLLSVGREDLTMFAVAYRGSKSILPLQSVGQAKSGGLAF